MSVLGSFLRKVAPGALQSRVARFPCEGIGALLVADPVLFDQTRSKSLKASRRIRGYPRPLLKGIVRPEPMKYGFRLPKPEEYTTEPLRIKKLGGRHPVTGRVVVGTIGGGWKKWAHWVDFQRDGPEKGYFEEKVYEIKDDGCQTAKIALVANGETKRWIISTEGVKVGDIIKTTREIPRIPVRARNGDGHPLGALPTGSKVHCIEKFPGHRAYYCRTAASSAEIVRKLDGRVVIQLPSKHTVSLSEHCLAIVGQTSNIERYKSIYPLGSAGALRRTGKRSRTGFWHRKDGYCGRKIKPPKRLKVVPLRKPLVTSEYVL